MEEIHNFLLTYQILVRVKIKYILYMGCTRCVSDSACKKARFCNTKTKGLIHVILLFILYMCVCVKLVVVLREHISL